MEKIDRYIKTLYLASSPIREEMLESLVEDALYEFNTYGLNFKDISDVIKETFLIEPISSELKETLERMAEKGVVKEESGKWELLEEAKQTILERELQHKAIEEQRYANYEKILPLIGFPAVEETLKNKVWKLYNEYIIECFRIHSKDALNFFLPYSKATETANGDHSIYQQYCESFPTKEERSIFEKLVTSYPKHICESDYTHLKILDSRGESIASLGLPKNEYEMFKDLGIPDWILVADTNFLYSALNLRFNKENEACQQLILLAKNKTLPFRIVYFPETLKEFKKKANDFNSTILRNKLTSNQIKALLASDQLDAEAKYYYQKKLEDSEEPHPSDIISVAEYSLKSKGIDIFRSKKLEYLVDEENGPYMNDQYREYSEYEKIRNDVRVAKGLGERMQKDISKVEHDILLREGILAIREGKEGFNEIKHYGLTLDTALIRFDSYALTKKYKSNLNVPTFFQPSLLLKKFRAYLPVTTVNYEKAYFQAITTKTYEPKKNLSVAVQKSMAHFHKLGIDDMGMILRMVSDDIFLKSFQDWEKQGEEEAEAFVESEIHKRIQQLDEEKELSKKQALQLAEEKATTEREAKERELQLTKEKADILRREKEKEDLLKHEALTASNTKQLLTKNEENNRQLLVDKQKSDALAQQEKEERIKAEKALQEFKEKERDTYLKKKLFWWRFWGIAELAGCILVTIAGIVYMLYLSNWSWSNMIDLATNMQKNLIVTFIIELITIYFNSVLIKSLSDKYRNHSNIKAFEERMLKRLPSHLK